MGLFELQFFATLENVTSLYLPPHDDYHFKVLQSFLIFDHLDKVHPLFRRAPEPDIFQSFRD